MILALFTVFVTSVKPVNGKLGNGKLGNGKLGNRNIRQPFFGGVGKVGNGNPGNEKLGIVYCVSKMLLIVM